MGSRYYGYFVIAEVYCSSQCAWATCWPWWQQQWVLLPDLSNVPQPGLLPNSRTSTVLLRRYHLPGCQAVAGKAYGILSEGNANWLGPLHGQRQGHNEVYCTEQHRGGMLEQVCTVVDTAICER